MPINNTIPPPLPSDYKVYCDESRHCESACNQHMAIGGLWVPSESRSLLNDQLQKVCSDYNLGAELKWSKTSSKYLDAYKRFTDVFWDFKEAKFRVILVPHEKIDYCKYHSNDQEEGFYKFYYSMLLPWLHAGNSYQLLLDRKSNRGSDRYHVLQRCLRRRAPKALIKQIQVIESRESRVAQLCDIMVGCIAAANSDPLPTGPKQELVQHVQQSLHIADLGTYESSYASFGKFNVFRIRLS